MCMPSQDMTGSLTNLYFTDFPTSDQHHVSSAAFIPATLAPSASLVCLHCTYNLLLCMSDWTLNLMCTCDTHVRWTPTHVQRNPEP